MPGWFFYLVGRCDSFPARSDRPPRHYGLSSPLAHSRALSFLVESSAAIRWYQTYHSLHWGLILESFLPELLRCVYSGRFID